MDNYLKHLALAVVLTTGTAAWAADSDNEIDSLRSNMSGGNTDAAWQQAKQMRQKWESDTQFDYLYGILALEHGQYNEAQFSLERVTMAEPGNVRARLALAKAYYKLGDERSARHQFEAVKQSNPPAYVMREVNHYLAGMEGGRTASFNGYVEAGLGHDNNVNMVNGSSSIANPLYDPLQNTSDPFILLNSKSRAQSDDYDFLNAGIDMYQPLDTDTGIEARGYIGQRNNFGSDRYDSVVYRGSASVVQLFGKDQYRVTLTAQDNRLSDSDYQEYYSLAGDWLRHNYGGWTLSSALFINELKYENDSLRDINQYIVSAGAQRQFGRFSNTVGLLLGDEDAQHATGDHNARAFTGVYYDLWYDLAGNQQLFARAYYQNAHQQGEDPFFHQVRDDNFGELTLGWDWHINKPLRLRTQIIYDDNESDIDYYSYDRMRVQTGLRYSF